VISRRMEVEQLSGPAKVCTRALWGNAGARSAAADGKISYVAGEVAVGNGGQDRSSAATTRSAFAGGGRRARSNDTSRRAIPTGRSE
jgi:hypothetical protein